MADAKSGIQRYEWAEDGHERNPTGEWVLHDDHLAAVAAERERCATLILNAFYPKAERRDP